MPFNGLSSFLPTKKESVVLKAIVVCQCPLTGYLHFYKTPFTKKGLCAVCQCPLTGYLHFYPCPSGAPCLQGFEGYVFPKFFENVTKVLHFAIFLFLQNFTTAHIKDRKSVV